MLMEKDGNGLYPAAGDVDVTKAMQNKCKTKLMQHSWQHTDIPTKHEAIHSG